jgi:crotonobetainyl-CoA:carnitine CoA-transferase CaiB-like acyl-CoA transferase
MRIDMQHADAGVIPLVASPLRLSETPVEYRRAPPRIGEHTREILGGMLGLDDGACDRLAERDVI